MISRISGFFRTVLLAAVLGTYVGDAFTIANVLPNLVEQLVLGAVLAAIVVPVLVRAEREDADGGARFTRQLVTMASTILIGATVIALVSAPLLVTIMLNRGDSVVDRDLTVAFAYLLLPQILFYGLTAVFAAILNTRGIFGPGAWAPVANNVIAISTLGLYFFIWRDPSDLSNAEILFLGIGTTLGVVAQVLVLLPSIRRAGVSLKPLWGLDARFRKFGNMALAIVVYVAISQVGFIVTYNVASGSSEGAALIYNIVWLLLQVPYGVLGVAVLTAIMPRMSRNAADGNNRAVVDDLTMATRMTMVALIPVIVLMTAAGPMIAQVLFAYGNFSTDDASVLGGALSLAAFSLVPYALVLLHLRVFYASHDAWTPTFIVVGITGVKVGLSLLAPRLANDETQVVAFLHFANGAGYVAGAIVGAMLLRYRIGPLRLRYTFSSMFMVFTASVVGAIGYLAYLIIRVNVGRAESFGRLNDWIDLFAATVIILGLTYAILYKLKVPEVQLVFGAFSRLTNRLRRKPVTTLTPPASSQESPDAPNQHPSKGTYLPYAGPEHTLSREVRDDTGDVSPGVAEGKRMKDSSDVVTDSNKGHGSETPAHDSAAPIDATNSDATSTEGEQRPPLTGERKPRLTPGTIVAGGRYRLVEEHGQARGLHFWQAQDLKLERDVALTFVMAGSAELQQDSELESHEVLLSRTLRLARIDSPGVARVLDVVKGRAGGIVISEWTPGQPLREIAETKPSAVGAARAVRALAAAAEAAHRAGTALSIDHPDRIRINTSGDAVLAFPGTAANADQAHDVHGLGAALYALVTGLWPLAEPGHALVDTGRSQSSVRYARPGEVVGGLTAPNLDDEGRPVDPRTIRAGLPYEISAVALRALHPSSGIRTAATVHQILDQATMADQSTDMIPVIRASQANVRPRAVRIKPQSVLMTPEERRKRARRVVAVLSLLAIATVIILTIAASKITQLLMTGSNTPPARQPLGFTAESQMPGPALDQADGGRSVSFTLTPSDVTVYSPEQQPDNPGDAGRAIDGNPDTAWATSEYMQQLPAFKNGVGLILTFNGAYNFSEIDIETSRPGSRVEVRLADDTSPELDDTVVIGNAELEDGVTTIPLNAGEESEHLLIWIDRLSEADGRIQGSISSIKVTAQQ
ncbi:murein biosynthesis integral membrane protein MurJ [Hoyosella rhizosphaerae]|uniref:Murein biosynthesis integral membrane protein MurJ n=2 Tax=Hoyosella rhizosphaerae TaxID=1755582 RepID=A0A916U9Y1_9ACTN|nr:murein biosynthesis integral membrane protein MurJ [Hoyosella rhizosphaerae]